MNGEAGVCEVVRCGVMRCGESEIGVCGVVRFLAVLVWFLWCGEIFMCVGVVFTVC